MTDKTAEQRAEEWIKNRLEGMATDDQFCPPTSTEVFLAGYEQGKKDAGNLRLPTGCYNPHHQKDQE